MEQKKNTAAKFRSTARDGVAYGEARLQACCVVAYVVGNMACGGERAKTFLFLHNS